jgi:hypothetical protein
MQLLGRVDERVGLLVQQALVGVDPAPADGDRKTPAAFAARTSKGESPT